MVNMKGSRRPFVIRWSTVFTGPCRGIGLDSGGNSHGGAGFFCILANITVGLHRVGCKPSKKRFYRWFIMCVSGLSDTPEFNSAGFLKVNDFSLLRFLR